MTDRPPNKPDDKYVHLKIRKRSWYEWLLWLMWLVSLIIIADFAIVTRQEYENQASNLAWVIVVFLLLGGLLIGFMRAQEAKDEDANRFKK